MPSFIQIALRAALLEQENNILRIQLSALRKELATLQQIVCSRPNVWFNVLDIAGKIVLLLDEFLSENKWKKSYGIIDPAQSLIGSCSVISKNTNNQRNM